MNQINNASALMMHPPKNGGTLTTKNHQRIDLSQINGSNVMGSTKSIMVPNRHISVGDSIGSTENFKQKGHSGINLAPINQQRIRTNS